MLYITPAFKTILDKMFEEDTYNFFSLILPILKAKEVGRLCLSNGEQLSKKLVENFNRYPQVECKTCDKYKVFCWGGCSIWRRK